MSQLSRRAVLEGAASDSLFPPEEAGSFTSRPTPVVPPSEELRTLGLRSAPPEVSGEIPRPSSRPTASFGPPPKFEQDFYGSPPAPVVTSLPPAREPRRSRSRARAIVSKLLFATLFAAVAGLLGLALKKKFDALRPGEPARSLIAR